MQNVGESWSLWELKGQTKGPTRGQLKERIAALDKMGWDLALFVDSVGVTGHWPHSMALWRIPDAKLLRTRLEAGFDDGLDETNLQIGKSTWLERVSGGISPGHRAFLLEHLRGENGAALRSLKGPDMVLAEALAPWQGVALWGAADLFDLAEKQRSGIGSGGQPGIVHTQAWWLIVPPNVTRAARP